MKIAWFRLWHGVRGHHVLRSTRFIIGHRLRYIECVNCDSGIVDW